MTLRNLPFEKMTQLGTSTDASTPTKKITVSYNAGKTDPLIFNIMG